MGTKKAYVIGTHVNKSLSPIIFNHWFKKYGINAKYFHKTIKEKNFNKDINKILKEKDIVMLVHGGHGFKVIKDVEMIEVKQGPYNLTKDKIKFSAINDKKIKLKKK